MLCQLTQLVPLQQLRKLSYGQLKTWYSGLVKRPPPDPPYSHVVQIGDPVLRVKSDPVCPTLIKSPEFQFLIKQLKSVFKKYDCVGLSACQIGITLRVFIVEFNAKHAKTYKSEEFRNKEISIVPQTVFINPVMKITDYTKITHSESCESIKGFWADVPRFQGIEIEGLNENGEQISLNAKGWLARMLQHELDHLDGKLYTDTMDRKSLTCGCWHVVNERRGKVEIPFSQ